jgi:hypothetical protein
MRAMITGLESESNAPQSRKPSSDALYDVLAQCGLRRRAPARQHSQPGELVDSFQLREHGAHVHLTMLRKADEGSMAVLDPSGLVVCWYARSGDFQRADRPVLGRHVEQFYVASDVAGHLAERHLEAAEAYGHSARDGWRLSASGLRFWGRTEIRVVLGADGNLDGFVHVIRPTCGSMDAASVAAPRPRAWLGMRASRAPECAVAGIAA